MVICLKHDYHGERSCPSCDGEEAAQKAFGDFCKHPTPASAAHDSQRLRELLIEIRTQLGFHDRGAEGWKAFIERLLDRAMSELDGFAPSSVADSLPIGQQIAEDAARDLDSIAAHIASRQSLNYEAAQIVTRAARMLERFARHHFAASATTASGDVEYDPHAIAQQWIEAFGNLLASQATATERDMVTLAKAFLAKQSSATNPQEVEWWNFAVRDGMIRDGDDGVSYIKASCGTHR